MLKCDVAIWVLEMMEPICIRHFCIQWRQAPMNRLPKRSSFVWMFVMSQMPLFQVWSNQFVTRGVFHQRRPLVFCYFVTWFFKIFFLLFVSISAQNLSEPSVNINKPCPASGFDSQIALRCKSWILWRIVHVSRPGMVMQIGHFQCAFPCFPDLILCSSQKRC